jgi:3-hydroxyacyl-[acyl-carrier-protein] dehydratase
MNLQDALGFLPHGSEFRFLDELLELDPGKSGKGVFQLKGDEDFLKGHFPGSPIFPGVLGIEAIAQLAGVVAQSDPGIPPLANLKLTAVRNAKIHAPISPGEEMQISVFISGRMGSLIQAEGQVSVRSQTVIQAQVTLAGA